MVASAEVGVLCFRSSSPLIARNRIAGNQEGLRCVQMSNPVVTENVFEGNGTAVFLHLSSYAVIRRNNLAGNETQIYLDNMSSDWERRVGKKPIRGRQAQNRSLVNLGRAVHQEYEDDAATEGYVDARENWWGDAVTGEMEQKGPDGNIASIQDYHDVPLRIYEGDPEEYVQDRVNFSGWLRQKVETAGPSAGVTQEGKE